MLRRRYRRPLLCATVYRCNKLIYVSKDILAHDDATRTSELSDVVCTFTRRGYACKQCYRNSLARRSIDAASSEHIFAQNDSDAVCLLQWCGGSYYRNVICIAGSVDTVAIESFLCGSFIFERLQCVHGDCAWKNIVSLFCICHYYNFHNKSRLRLF